MTATCAPVAAYDHLQRGRTPPERLVRQSPGHGVTRRALAPAAAAPPVRLHDPAGDHSAVGLQTLPNGFEAEFDEWAERGQVRASKGSVVHVEVFWMGRVRTSILGRPRRLPRDDAPAGATPSSAMSRQSPDRGPCWVIRAGRTRRRGLTALRRLLAPQGLRRRFDGPFWALDDLLWPPPRQDRCNPRALEDAPTGSCRGVAVSRDRSRRRGGRGGRSSPA